MIILKKYILAVSLFCALMVLSNAQSQPKWSEVRQSDKYIYGEGLGVTTVEADRKALEELLIKLNENISGRFDSPASIVEADDSAYIAKIVASYLSPLKGSARSFVIRNEPTAYIVRYMNVDDLDDLFVSRRAKIRTLVTDALVQEQKLCIDNALRYLGWAYLLNQSLPSPEYETYTDADGNTHSLDVWIPERMNDIMNKVEVKTALKEDDNAIYLSFYYGNSPISSVDFTYCDDDERSALVSAKDGMGILEFRQQHKPDAIRIEYQYKDNAHIDDDVIRLVNVVKPLELKGADKRLGGRAQAVHNVNSDEPDDLTEVIDGEKYNSILNKVITAIQKKEYDSVSHLFTEDGLAIYGKLLKYGNARILDTDVVLHNLRDNVVARGVNMAFSFRNGVRKQFVEDVVFTFNREGLIDNICFGLGNQCERDILYKGVWPEDVRVLIMEFLENYKTAFALERLDYIQGIFDDNAVIIIGRKVSRRITQKSDDYLSGMTIDQIEFVRKTKEDYLVSLKRCFDSNEFINIRFTNTDVMKCP